MSNKIILKKDKYRKKRGDYSRWLVVLCENCKSPIVSYQKDGPGILKRLYFDRIVAPADFTGLDKKPIKSAPPLICRKCKKVLGVPFIWAKEKRPVYRLFVGAVDKKIVSLEALDRIRFK